MIRNGLELASFLERSGFVVEMCPVGETGSGYMFAFNKGWV